MVRIKEEVREACREESKVKRNIGNHLVIRNRHFELWDGLRRQLRGNANTFQLWIVVEKKVVVTGAQVGEDANLPPKS